MSKTKCYYFKYHHFVRITIEHFKCEEKEEYTPNFIIFGFPYKGIPTETEINNYILAENTMYPTKLLMNIENIYNANKLKSLLHNPKWNKIKNQSSEKEYHYLCQFILDELNIQTCVNIQFQLYDPFSIKKSVLYNDLIYDNDSIFDNIICHFKPIKHSFESINYIPQKNISRPEFYYILSFWINPYLQYFGELPECINISLNCENYKNYVRELTLRKRKLSYYPINKFPNLHTIRSSINELNFHQNFDVLIRLNSLILLDYDVKYDSRYNKILFAATNLTHLEIKIYTTQYHSIKNIIELFKYVQNNSVLINLSLSIDFPSLDATQNYQKIVNAIYKLIKYNTTLEKLHLTQNAYTQNLILNKQIHYDDYLLRSIQHNTTLIDIKLCQNTQNKSLVNLSNMSILSDFIDNCHTLQSLKCNIWTQYYCISIHNTQEHNNNLIKEYENAITNIINTYYYKSIIKSLVKGLLKYKNNKVPCYIQYLSNHKKYNKLLSKLAQ